LKYNFSTILEYSPRGDNDVSKMSRKIVGSIKNAQVDIIKRITEIIKTDPEAVHILSQLDKATLVPVPRSEPLVKGGLWPTKSICEIFISEKLGDNVVTLINRNKKVPKSSLSYSAKDRPTVNTHINSFSLITPNMLVDLNKLVIVDDVFTLGRTSVACATFLKKYYPDSKITILSLVRTRSLKKNIEKIRVIKQEEVSYNTASGYVELPD